LWYLDLRFPDLGWRDRYPQMAVWYADFAQRPSMRMVWSL
jgi:glutathione S-transferase